MTGGVPARRCPRASVTPRRAQQPAQDLEHRLGVARYAFLSEMESRRPSGPRRTSLIEGGAVAEGTGGFVPGGERGDDVGADGGVGRRRGRHDLARSTADRCRTAATARPRRRDARVEQGIWRSARGRLGTRRRRMRPAGTRSRPRPRPVRRRASGGGRRWSSGGRQGRDDDRHDDPPMKVRRSRRSR